MFTFRRVGAIFVAGALALSLGCNEKKDAPPPPSGGIPPLDQPQHPAAAKPSDHPVHEPGAAAPADDKALPPGHPPVAGAPAEGAAPGGMQGMTPGDIPFDAKTVLSGVIKLDPKLKGKVQDGDVIFLVARQFDPSGVQGPPLAVRKLTAGTFPLNFSLDSRDAMIVGTKLAGKVVVTARVDKDGDAMTKNPGDIIGQSKAVEPPSAKVVVDLDKVL
jgi:hypothetical protein